jgi:hypothetical protein
MGIGKCVLLLSHQTFPINPGEAFATKPISTTALTALHRWTFYRSVTAEHAAVSGFWLYDGFAAFTLVKVLTCIDWHFFLFLVATVRTGNG